MYSFTLSCMECDIVCDGRALVLQQHQRLIIKTFIYIFHIKEKKTQIWFHQQVSMFHKLV